MYVFLMGGIPTIKNGWFVIAIPTLLGMILIGSNCQLFYHNVHFQVLAAVLFSWYIVVSRDSKLWGIKTHGYTHKTHPQLNYG